MKKQLKPRKTAKQKVEPIDVQPFMGHVNELKNRLFFVAVSFVAITAAAYSGFSLIEQLLLAPLDHQKLYYLTPAGGLSFIIKICMYTGLVFVLPVMIYHLYKFVTPAFRSHRQRAILYTVASTFLAICGVSFAYFISLPAALHFLTSIDLGGITPLLTIDAYVSFLMAYIVAGALLFQLPLILMIINSVTPLPPKKLMGAQRYVIIGSFILAAILSPTPDVINQTIMAAPMVAMYQVGAIGVWAGNRKQRKAVKTQEKQIAFVSTPIPNVPAPPAVPLLTHTINQPSRTQSNTKRPIRSVDGFSPRVRLTI